MRDRLSVLLFALLLSTYAYFYNGSGGNQVARLNLTRAIVEKGRLYSNEVGYTTDDELRIDGRRYSSKAPGVSVLGVPPFAALDGVRRLVSADAPRARNVVVHLTTLVTVGVPCAVMGAVLFWVLGAMGFAQVPALLAVVAITLGTTFLPYATMYMGHSLAGAVITFAFALLFDARRRREAGEVPVRQVLGAGLFTGLAVLIEYPLGMAALLLTVYLLSTRPSARELGAWVLGGAVSVAALLLYNVLAFGNALSLSYLKYTQLEKNPFPVHEQGFGGVSWPRLDILDKMLFSEVRGLIYFSPILFLAVPGLVWWGVRRRDHWREITLVVGMMVAFLAFNAGYGESIQYWGGANSAGPRHLIPMFPFVALPLAALFSVAPGLFLPLVLGACVLLLMITATLPQIHQLYGAPLPELIVPYFLDGRLSVARGGMVSQALVTADSVAYNWGKLLGIPGSWSLLPLLVLVGGLAAALLVELRRRGAVSAWGGRLAGGGVGLTLVLLVGVPLVHQRASAAPLDGPGVLLRTFGSKRCEGAPVWVGRVPGLSSRYGKRLELRPFPGDFCGRWQTMWDVDRAGDLEFQVKGREAHLWIDGTEVPFQPEVGARFASWITTHRLEEGPHLIQLEVGVEAIRGDPGLRYRVAGRGSFRPVPPEHLAVPAELVASGAWPSPTKAPGGP